MRNPRLSAKIVAVFVCFLILAGWLQYQNGAWSADLAGYDESAHYTSGVMVREYLASFQWLQPIPFAKRYYDFYPKVAIGHWPPMFYVVQGLWGLPFSASRTSIMTLMTVEAALCAFLIFWIWRNDIGQVAAACAGGLFLTLHVVQWLTSLVMAEHLVLIWSLLAIHFFCRYLRSERQRDSILFGCFAAAAVMTKANGFALALLPPIAVLLCRRLDLVARRSFWMPAAVVGAVAIPWYLVTFRAAKAGWTSYTDPKELVGIVALFNWNALNIQLGVAILCAAAIGFTFAVVVPAMKGRALPAIWSVTAAALLATFIFHSFLAPVRDHRHLTLAYVCCLVFAAQGVRTIASWLPGRRELVAGVLGALVIAAFGVQCFGFERKQTFGAANVARFLSHSGDVGENLLVVSPDASGEGGIIAEFAMVEPYPRHRIVRGTKVLADSTWNGESYELVASTPKEVMKIVTDRKISLLIFQRHPANPFRHYGIVSAMLREYPQNFLPLKDAASIGTFEVYRVCERPEK